MTSQLSTKDDKITKSQFDSLHLWFEWVAKELNEQGKSMQQVITLPVKPTKLAVKEWLWKPLMLSMFGHKSTKDLKKQKEIDDIYDCLNLGLAEIGIEVPRFPSAEDLLLDEESKKYDSKNNRQTMDT